MAPSSSATALLTTAGLCRIMIRRRSRTIENSMMMMSSSTITAMPPSRLLLLRLPRNDDDDHHHHRRQQQQRTITMTSTPTTRQQQQPPQQQQQQQLRHQSDHLKRRAIDALKSTTTTTTTKNVDDDASATVKVVDSLVHDSDDRGGRLPPPRSAAAMVVSDAHSPPPPTPIPPYSATKDRIIIPTPPTAMAVPIAPAAATTSDHQEPDDDAARKKNATDSVASNDGRVGATTTSTDPPVVVGVVDSAANGNIIVTSSSSSANNHHHSPPHHHHHLHEFAPKIVVVGVGGAGTNAVNNMVACGLGGVEFLALNTDAQHLSTSISPNRLQIGTQLTSGLGCGANPDAGRLAAEESRIEIERCIEDAHMVFITAGMGGGTGTGAAPVVASLCYDLGILTVSVVTTPFKFEGTHRRRLANEGIDRLRDVSDTLIVVPNQNLFRLVGERTSFVESFKLADNVLLAGVRSITDLMTSPGLINLDFADVQSVMHGMGNALLGTGQACDDDKDKSNGADAAERSADDDDIDDCRAIRAARMALNNPLLGEGKMDVGSAKGMLVNITGGSDMTLYEVDRAAEYITERVRDPDANIIFGSAYDEKLTGCVRVSVVATGIDEG